MSLTFFLFMLSITNVFLCYLFVGAKVFYVWCWAQDYYLCRTLLVSWGKNKDKEEAGNRAFSKIRGTHYSDQNVRIDKALARTKIPKGVSIIFWFNLFVLREFSTFINIYILFLLLYVLCPFGYSSQELQSESGPLLYVVTLVVIVTGLSLLYTKTMTLRYLKRNLSDEQKF